MNFGLTSEGKSIRTKYFYGQRINHIFNRSRTPTASIVIKLWVDGSSTVFQSVVVCPEYKVEAVIYSRYWRRGKFLCSRAGVSSP